MIAKVNCNMSEGVRSIRPSEAEATYVILIKYLI